MTRNYRKSRQSYPDGVLLVCDSGAKHMDRYMVVYEPVNDVFPYVSMSDNPFHPQGCGQHGEMDTRYTVWGTKDKVLEFEELPMDCQQLVLQDLKQMEVTND